MKERLGPAVPIGRTVAYGPGIGRQPLSPACTVNAGNRRSARLLTLTTTPMPGTRNDDYAAEVPVFEKGHRIEVSQYLYVDVTQADEYFRIIYGR